MVAMCDLPNSRSEPSLKEVRVVAVEETAQTIYLVLPSVSTVGEGEELSDRELESVAGGGSWSTCDDGDPHCYDPQ
jgi:hypothetical protein